MSSPTHKCLIDLCDEQVELRWAVCGTHWRIIPRPMLEDVIRAYVPSVGMGLEFPSPALKKALLRVHAHLKAEVQPRREYDPGDWVRLVANVRARDAARAERRVAAGPQPPNLWLVP